MQNSGIHSIRTFLAIAIDDAARQKLAEAQDAMKRMASGVSWVATPNIHLTLVFLGDIFETLVDPIRKALDGITSKHAPCAFDIKGLGYFGRPRSPKVIWAGLPGDIRPLVVLQEQIITALKAKGLSPDTKPFKPHLTIGRVRSSRHARELVEFIGPRNDILFGRLDVQRVLLMKSQLTPQGPIYSILHESPLKTV